MRRVIFYLPKVCLGLLGFFILHGTLYAIKPGDYAPNFQELDSNGQTRRLSEFKGKTIILEWHNNGCPYVKKHYESGNMQELIRYAKSKGFVWLTVISSAPGKQGHVTGAEANEYARAQSAEPSAILLDEDGSMGKSFEAVTTPHMYIISPEGIILYNGAIDDKNSTDKKDIPKSKNYIRTAIDELLGKKQLSISTTKPYGCSVKYP
jgi:hypothetical protein